MAANLAQGGKLVTFGIVAHAPETGYGYIRRGEGEGPAYPVAQFIEKPPLDLAAQFVASGDYYWNSGMFVFKASRYLAELQGLCAGHPRRGHSRFRGGQNRSGFRAHRQGGIR